MSLTIQQSSEFSPANVQFSKLRKNKNGGKAVYLNAGQQKALPPVSIHAISLRYECIH